MKIFIIFAFIFNAIVSRFFVTITLFLITNLFFKIFVNSASNNDADGSVHQTLINNGNTETLLNHVSKANVNVDDNLNNVHESVYDTRSNK